MLLLLLACTADEPAATPPEGCVHDGTEGATATCLAPRLDPEHYVHEALAYFDTLDVDAPRDSVPAYHPDVIRWEWPPWLLLTGFGAESMDATAELLRGLDPSTVPERDCRFFETQPFARCFVVFEYEGGPCPIYEEFTFDDDGRTVFVEAWSDLDGLRPHADVSSDPFGERDDLGRLATRVPGLGAGVVDFDSPWMVDAAAADPDVADLAARAEDWWAAWLEEYSAADDDFFAVGCGW